VVMMMMIIIIVAQDPPLRFLLKFVTSSTGRRPWLPSNLANSFVSLTLPTNRHEFAPSTAKKVVALSKKIVRIGSPKHQPFRLE